MISSLLGRRGVSKGAKYFQFPISCLHFIILSSLADTIRRKIIDDGFDHILTVVQDRKCGGIRLHAAVRNGELRRCPVWTAFGKS